MKIKDVICKMLKAIKLTSCNIRDEGIQGLDREVGMEVAIMLSRANGVLVNNGGKGAKPSNYSSKKMISNKKFDRVFNQNLHSAGTATVYKNYSLNRSLQAVMVDDYIYCKFPCSKQNKNQLNTYTVRYSRKSAEDFIQFQKYASPVLSGKW